MEDMTSSSSELEPLDARRLVLINAALVQPDEVLFFLAGVPKRSTVNVCF
jgi:hypothetical protein